MNIFHTFMSGVSLFIMSLLPAKADIPEKVKVHTDRDIYIAGENLFFSVRVLPADTAASNICYMMLRGTGKDLNELYIHMENAESHGSFTISDTLKTGYYELVAFTNYMRNFGEQTYFRKQIIIVNRFDESLDKLISQELTDVVTTEQKNAPLEIMHEKDSVGTREEVKLTIHAYPGFFERFDSVVTITVKQKMLLNTGEADDSGQKQVQLSGRAEAAIRYPKEKAGIYLDSRISNKDSVPLQQACLYLSAPDTFANLQYAFSDDEGKFRFFVPGYYMGKQLFLNTRERLEDNVIVPDDKFNLQSEFQPSPIRITQEFRKYILESQELVRIQKSYQINHSQSVPPDINQRIPYVYGEAASVIYPSRFVHLNNLKEIAANIVPDLRIREVDGRYLPFVVNAKTTMYFSEPAAIFIDGIPVHDLNPYMKWSSAEIQKIELCKSLRVKGDIAFPGIVAIFSNRKKNESVDGVKNVEAYRNIPEIVIPGALSYSMSSFSEYTLFAPPRYRSKSLSSPAPDFRQLLYWNPGLQLKGESQALTFYTSDWPAEYIVEVSGNSRDGEPFRVTSKLKVYE